MIRLDFIRARQVEEEIEKLLETSWPPGLDGAGGQEWRRWGTDRVWKNELEAGWLARMVSRLLSWWSLSRYFCFIFSNLLNGADLIPLT